MLSQNADVSDLRVTWRCTDMSSVQMRGSNYCWIGLSCSHVLLLALFKSIALQLLFFLFPQYQCLCKSHVVGRKCDRCAHGHYNFSGSNPSGCSTCRCSTHGTVSGAQNCHLQSGHCDCKNHVIGAKCDHCRDGYYGKKSQDILGCKGEFFNLRNSEKDEKIFSLSWNPIY